MLICLHSSVSLYVSIHPHFSLAIFPSLFLFLFLSLCFLSILAAFFLSPCGLSHLLPSYSIAVSSSVVLLLSSISPLFISLYSPFFPQPVFPPLYFSSLSNHSRRTLWLWLFSDFWHEYLIRAGTTDNGELIPCSNRSRCCSPPCRVSRRRIHGNWS